MQIGTAASCWRSSLAATVTARPVASAEAMIFYEVAAGPLGKAVVQYGSRWLLGRESAGNVIFIFTFSTYLEYMLFFILNPAITGV